MSYKVFSPSDISQPQSALNQLVDIIQEDISGSSTRRKYQVFVTGGIGPGITSSLFQTVYDQDYSLQTANPIFDMSIGLWDLGQTVTGSPGYQKDSTTNKLLFSSQSIMMREKVDTYRQFANYLLGDPDAAFWLGATTYPNNSNTTSTTYPAAYSQISEALFINIKRLFARDTIKKESFAMRFYESASISGNDAGGATGPIGTEGNSRHSAAFLETLTTNTSSNIGSTAVSSEEGVQIFADVGANADSVVSPGGNVARLFKASNTSIDVGLLFYDAGIAILDLKRACWADQAMSGTIDAMNNTAYGDVAVGSVIMGTGSGDAANVASKFIPDFLVSASIDNIIDHIAATRFSSGTLTSCAFQNQTQIQSTIYFCRANPNEYNFSSNPTFTDSSGNMNVIEDNTDPNERSFTFITTIGLYSTDMELLAVGKLSRPIEKNDEKDLTVRVRLDF